MLEELKIIHLRGPDIHAYITRTAQLRCELFRNYPYLYESEIANEEKHLQSYAECADSILVLVLDHQQVVGMSAGLPLSHAIDIIQKPFVDKGYPLKEIFYFGESLLQYRYRSRGIYRRFYRERESAARFSRYITAAFGTIERPLTDPAKPAGYIAMNDFWKRLGYQKHPELTASLNWKDLNEEAESTKTMSFWLKNLWK